MTSRWLGGEVCSMSRWLRRLLAVVVICPTSRSEAACSVDQVSACKAAASRGQLSDYRASGQCIVKQYVQFTHVCTVSDYLPSVDHCCCPISDNALLCCRYHQDWYHFRCMDADDQVTLNSEASWLTRWQLLLPLVLCSVAFIALIIVIFVCCRYVRRRRRAPAEPDMTSSPACYTCLLVFGIGGKKRHVTGSTMTPPTCAEPSAPPMSSSSNFDVTRHVTCEPETVSVAPLCRRCGAAVAGCSGDVAIHVLQPPSYEWSQQLHSASGVT